MDRLKSKFLFASKLVQTKDQRPDAAEVQTCLNGCAARPNQFVLRVGEFK